MERTVSVPHWPQRRFCWEHVWSVYNISQIRKKANFWTSWQGWYLFRERTLSSLKSPGKTLVHSTAICSNRKRIAAWTLTSSVVFCCGTVVPWDGWSRVPKLAAKRTLFVSSVSQNQRRESNGKDRGKQYLLVACYTSWENSSPGNSAHQLFPTCQIRIPSRRACSNRGYSCSRRDAERDSVSLECISGVEGAGWDRSLWCGFLGLSSGFCYRIFNNHKMESISLIAVGIKKPWEGGGMKVRK